MAQRLYKVEDIDDYQKRLSKEQAEELLKHCNEFGIHPEICAWYDDMEDFYTDWVNDNKIFQTRVEANERFTQGVLNGEFKRFTTGEIVRLVM